MNGDNFQALLDSNSKKSIMEVIKLCDELWKVDSSFVCLDGNKLGLVQKTKPRPPDDSELKVMLELTNAIFIPVSEIVKHYPNGKETRHLKLFAIQDGEVLEPITIPVEELLNEKWIYKNWGLRIRLNIESPYRYVLQSIQVLCKSERVSIIHLYAYVGWLKNQDWVWLHGGGTIGRDCSDLVMADASVSDLNLLTEDITEEEACLFVLDTMFNIADKKVAWTLISFCLLSLMTSKLREIGGFRPEHILYIVGETGQRKTSLSIRCFNFYKKYHDRVPIHFDMATQPALEIMGITLRDCVCLYDDIPPAIDKETKRAQIKKMEAITRTYGESVGRQKMESPNKKVEMKPEGLAAVTAERRILRSSSSLSRILEVKVENGAVNLKNLSKAQKHYLKFPTFISFMIREIAERGDDFLNRLIARFKQNRLYFTRYFKGGDKMHGRLVNAAAWQQAAFEEVINFMGKCLSSEARKKAQFDAETMICDYSSILSGMIWQQQQMITGSNEVNLFVQAFKELLAINKIRLLELDLRDKERVVEEDIKSKDVGGFIDSEYIYLLKDTIYGTIANHLNKLERVIPNDFLESLAAKGLLKPDANKDKTKTVRITVNKQRIRVIRLDRDRVEDWNDH